MLKSIIPVTSDKILGNFSVYYLYLPARLKKRSFKTKLSFLGVNLPVARQRVNPAMMTSVKKEAVAESLPSEGKDRNA